MTSDVHLPILTDGRPILPQVQGTTRDCLEPWRHIFVHADETVTLCCWSPPIGMISEPNVFHSEKAVRLREGLLTGDLADCCRRCIVRQWTSVEQQQQNVKIFLEA